MKTHLPTLCLVVLSLCACGPKANISGGKQGAAEALYAMSTPLKGGADHLGSGIDIGLNISAACPKGGTVVMGNFGLGINPNGGGGTSVSQTFDATYNNCGVQTDLGTSVLSGTEKVNQLVQTSSSGAEVDQTFQGKMIWGGACDDFLDVDVTQKVAVSALSQTGGGVSMLLRGKVANRSGSYTYDEAVSVTPGKISVEIESVAKK